MMSKRVTNLRAKNGAYFELDEEAKSIALVSTVRDVEPRLIDDTQFDQIEFDVVAPEYQVGDVVAIRQKPGDDLKGFITYKYDHEDQGEIFLVAVADKSSPWKFYVEDNVTSLGGWQIVGLWDEEKIQ